MLSRILPWIRRTWVCQGVCRCSGAPTPSLGPGRPRCRAGRRLWQWDRDPDGPPLEQRLPAEGFYQPGRLRPNHQKVQRKTKHLSWYVRYSHPAKNRKKVWSVSGIFATFMPFWLLYGIFSSFYVSMHKKVRRKTRHLSWYVCYSHPAIKKNGKCQNVLGQFIMSGYNSHKTGPLLQGERMYAALHGH